MGTDKLRTEKVDREGQILVESFEDVTMSEK